MAFLLLMATQNAANATAGLIEITAIPPLLMIAGATA
jgi:hypothetical protein